MVRSARHWFLTLVLLLSWSGSSLLAADAGEGGIIGWGGSHFYSLPFFSGPVVKVAAGGSHSLALRSNGTVLAWGNKSYVQTTAPPAATNVMAIAAGAIHSLALCSNGTVLAWGDNRDGQTNVPAAATNVVAIAAREFSSMALYRLGPPDLAPRLESIEMAEPLVRLRAKTEPGWLIQVLGSTNLQAWSEVASDRSSNALRVFEIPKNSLNSRFFKLLGIP